MKTTPNPRATKNNRGELVGPLLPPPPPPPDGELVAGGRDAVSVAENVDIVVIVGKRRSRRVGGIGEGGDRGVLGSHMKGPNVADR